MAKRDDKDSIPNIPANASDMMFAEDLIHHVLLQDCPSYVRERDPISFRRFAYNPLDATTRRAIEYYRRVMEDCNRITFRHMQNSNVINPYNFIIFTNKLSSNFTKEVLAEGFNPIDFLFYCASVSNMAALFYNRKVLIAPALAKANIISTLRKHMPADGWQTIHRAAERAVKALEERERSLKSRDSSEIEIPNRLKVRGDTSRNTLQSEEQNVLSETGEKCIDKKIQCTDLKYEISLKRLAQSSSGKSSAIDLSPLNASKSSKRKSDLFSFEENKCSEILGLKDKSDTGTSNIDNKPILIKNVSKRKMNPSWNDSKGVESQTLFFKEQIKGKSTLDDRFCPGPSSAYQVPYILSKSNDRINPDPHFNAKDFETPKILSFEGDKHIDISSKAMFPTETSNIQKSSGLTNENEIDISDYKQDANYQPLHSDENNLVIETEPNEKLVSEISNLDQASVHSAEEKFDSFLDKENNGNVKNSPLTDQEESPNLKGSSTDLKFGSFSPPSSDTEKSPSGKTDCK